LVCYSRPKVYTYPQNFIRMTVFIVSASGGQKPQFCTNFDIVRLEYQPPFTDDSQIWCAIADPWCTLTCQISSRSVYSVALWRRKTPIFAIFWTLAFSEVAIWQQSEKVEHGCTTANLPLSNGIKIVSVLHRLHGKIGRRNSDVQKRDGQTDKKNSTFLATPSAGEIRAHPNLAW